MKKDKKFDSESLGGRLKGYEAEYEREIEPESHIIVRIDGHKFSKFTKGFEKPFDDILSKAMELTTKDLLTEFNAVSAYTQSDEITLVIPSLMNLEKHKGNNTPKWGHAYSGRVQKMASLIAGFTTMKFNKHLGLLIHTSFIENKLSTEEMDYHQNIMSKKLGNAWFDCRIYGVLSDEEAFNSVLWRVRDAEKNSRSMFAQSYCSHRELQGLNGLEQVQYCLEKTGKDWHKIDNRYKYGILVKREKYLKPVAMSEGGTMDYSQNEFVERTRVVQASVPLTFTDANVRMIMTKTF